MSLAENEGEPNLGYHVLLRALGARPQWGGGWSSAWTAEARSLGVKGTSS